MSDGVGGQGKAGIPISRTLGGKVEASKTNLILGLQGNAALQKKLAMGEYRGKKRKDWRNEGFTPEESKTPTKRGDLPRFRVWYLPSNFCPDCGRTDIHDNTTPGTPRAKPNPGLTMLGETREDLGLRRGDLIGYFHCPQCMETAWREQEGAKDGLLLDQYGNNLERERGSEKVDQLADERAERMQRNVYEWIRAARLRGFEPKEYEP